MMQIYLLAMANPLIAKKLAKFLAELKEAIDQVDAALAIQRKSGFTEEINLFNDRRHSLLTALKGAVRGFLKVDNTQKEAKALVQLFKDYGIKRKMQISQATGLFSNLITDLEGPFAGAIKAMNLQSLVANLKEANNSLQQVSEERLDEANANGTARLAEARKRADEAYHRFIEALESLMLLEGEEQYIAFVDRLNTEIKYYKQQALGEKVTETIPGAGGDNQDGNHSGDDGEEEPPQG
jgi:hypothetical protein